MSVKDIRDIPHHNHDMPGKQHITQMLIKALAATQLADINDSGENDDNKTAIAAAASAVANGGILLKDVVSGNIAQARQAANWARRCADKTHGSPRVAAIAAADATDAAVTYATEYLA